MFLKLTGAAALAATVMIASSANATIVRNYQLNESLADSAGSGVDAVNNGGALGGTGITFGANQGPTVTGLSLSTYTITTSFDFDTTNSWRKIIDFKDLASDNGLYNLNTELYFVNSAFGPSGTFTAGLAATVVLTRDGGTGLVTGYVNGVQQISFTDAAGDAIISGPLRFFQDDTFTGGREASSGFVDYITISNSVDAPAGGVPEPASWALMILGFGGVGAAMRRRTGTALV